MNPSLLTLLLLLPIVAGIVVLNVWDYRRRKILTAAQRREEDRETDAWLAIW